MISGSETGRIDFPKVAIIVLGAAVWKHGQPSPTLKRRAEWGALLFKSQKASLLIGSGGIGRNPPSEGSVIVTLCEKSGVPKERMIAEEASHSTEDNIRLSVALIENVSDWSIYIVTDYYHAPRARLIARRLGYRVFTSSPPLRGTKMYKLAFSLFREVPAILLEIWHLIRISLRP